MRRRLITPKLQLKRKRPRNNLSMTKRRPRRKFTTQKNMKKMLSMLPTRLKKRLTKQLLLPKVLPMKSRLLLIKQKLKPSMMNTRLKRPQTRPKSTTRKMLTP